MEKIHKGFIWFLVISAALVIGHLSGRAYQHFRNGYVYTEHKVTTFPYNDGSVALKYVTESVGFQLWDANMSLLELRQAGGENIMIYRSRRGFQEPDNVARNVRIDGRNIQWEDLFYRYSLHLEPMEDPESEPTPDR